MTSILININVGTVQFSKSNKFTKKKKHEKIVFIKNNVLVQWKRILSFFYISLLKINPLLNRRQLYHLHEHFLSSKVSAYYERTVVLC